MKCRSLVKTTSTSEHIINSPNHDNSKPSSSSSRRISPFIGKHLSHTDQENLLSLLQSAEERRQKYAQNLASKCGQEQTLATALTKKQQSPPTQHDLLRFPTAQTMPSQQAASRETKIIDASNAYWINSVAATLNPKYTTSPYVSNDKQQSQISSSSVLDSTAGYILSRSPSTNKLASPKNQQPTTSQRQMKTQSINNHSSSSCSSSQKENVSGNCLNKRQETKVSPVNQQQPPQPQRVTLRHNFIERSTSPLSLLKESNVFLQVAKSNQATPTLPPPPPPPPLPQNATTAQTQTTQVMTRSSSGQIQLATIKNNIRAIFNRCLSSNDLGQTAASRNQQTGSQSDRRGYTDISSTANNLSSVSGTSIMDTTQLTTAQNKCFHHPNKKGKYIVLNIPPPSSATGTVSHSHHYCSKCAVDLSKKGFQTIHFADYTLHQQQEQQEHDILGPSYSPRQLKLEGQNDDQTLNQQPQILHNRAIKLKEISEFFTTISEQGVKWQELNHALLVKKNDVSGFYDRQENRVECQFQEYEQLLISLRSEALTAIQTSREHSILAYQSWEKQTKERLTDFLNIKADIEMNNERIVEQIQMDDFNRIMVSYKDKLSSMNSFFASVANHTLDLTKFDTRSSFSMLAQQIAASFKIVNFTTTLVKKRVTDQAKQAAAVNANANATVKPQRQLSRNNTPSPRSKLFTSRSTAQTIGFSSSSPPSSSSHCGRGVQVGSYNVEQSLSSSSGGRKLRTMAFTQAECESQEEYVNSYSPPRKSESNNVVEISAADQNNSSFFFFNVSSPAKKGGSEEMVFRKDVYVSFGENKDQLLHRAIQQAKTQNEEEKEEEEEVAEAETGGQSHSMTATILTCPENYFTSTPSEEQNRIHKVRPLTDIQENSNLNETEDEEEEEEEAEEEEERNEQLTAAEDYRNQINRRDRSPNTPELKQATEMITSHSQLKLRGCLESQSAAAAAANAFRTLFEDEEDSSSAPTSGVVKDKSQMRYFNTSDNGQRSNRCDVTKPQTIKKQFQQNESVKTGCSSSSNNQLEEYIAMLERHATQAQFEHSIPANAVLEVVSLKDYDHCNNDDDGECDDDDHDDDQPLFSSPNTHKNI